MQVRPLRLYNSLAKKVEDFHSIEPGQVKLYACGPTVYHYAHIGNLRTYITEDILKRTLQRAGYHVTHVMNITDVGHLQSDADTGEDKMQLAVEREKKTGQEKTVWQIARFYEEKFFADCDALKILRPTIVCRATEHIADMIGFVRDLEVQGVTYTKDNVYFDVSKFDRYYALNRKKSSAGLGEPDPSKRHPHDFVLWFSLAHSKFPQQTMRWDSPWGVGFPGWHIECSAMAMKYLGDKIDIHCGGKDHIDTHHTNELAQSESRTGQKWVNYWVHSEFLVKEDGSKMSKSIGDFLTLPELVEKGFQPIHFRYLCLKTHYRAQLKFSMALLEKARDEYESLKMQILEVKILAAKDNEEPSREELALATALQHVFKVALLNDLDTVTALGHYTKVINEKNLSAKTKLAILTSFDETFDLGVKELELKALDENALKAITIRSAFRRTRHYAAADLIREGFGLSHLSLFDSPSGMTLWSVQRDKPSIAPAPSSVSTPSPSPKTFATDELETRASLKHSH